MKRCATSWLVVMILSITSALAAPEKPSASAPEAKKPEAAEPKKEPAAKAATVPVKKGPFRVEVTLDGVFEAQSMIELVLRPQEWSGLTVLSAVEHGAAVRRGDLVVALDLEKIDRAIADLRAEQLSAELSLQQAEQTLRTLEALAPLDVAAAERTNRVAQEDWKLFFEVKRPLLLKTLDFSLKMAQEMLEYQQEELRQLEKMYKADEITEETEEIVLRRARNALERAKFLFERAKIDHEDSLKYDMPRMDEKLKDATQRAAFQWEKDKVTLPLAVQKQRLDLEKLRLQRARNEERLGKLLSDRAIMTVTAPADGLVYYGRCARGKWSSGPGGDELRRGSTISPNAVFVTIVQARPVFIRTTIAEKDLHQLRAGVKGIAKPTGFPDLRLSAILERINPVPLAGGFDARLTVALDEKAAGVLPGMSCSVKLSTYEKRDALTVPAAAVAPDELDEQKHYVQVVLKDGTAKKQLVTVGRRSERLFEIVAGLKEGDEVLAEFPKEKK